MKLTAILRREGDMYVALCPELDIASQGYTVEEAKNNLKEAVSLFFECASEEEIKSGHFPGSDLVVTSRGQILNLAIFP